MLINLAVPVKLFRSLEKIPLHARTGRSGNTVYKGLLFLQMISPPNLGSAPAFAITSCILMTLTVSAAPKQAANAVTEIKAVLKAQQDGWNRGDIDRFMNGYARSASTVFVSEDAIRRGWQTVRDRYKKKYSSRAKMGTLTFSDLEITLLSSDSAVASGRWKLKRADDEPHGRFTLILRRLPEGWRIVYDHTSAAPPKK
jgi:ketosteroid isomerase-like protein